MEDSEKFERLKIQLNTYKKKFSGNIRFDSAMDTSYGSSFPNYSEYNYKLLLILFFFNYYKIIGMPMDYAPLQIIHIYFDTWTRTFDQVERDAKTTLNAMLGVIGGTMGLLTGTKQAYYLS